MWVFQSILCRKSVWSGRSGIVCRSVVFSTLYSCQIAYFLWCERRNNKTWKWWFHCDYKDRTLFFFCFTFDEPEMNKHGWSHDSKITPCPFHHAAIWTSPTFSSRSHPPPPLHPSGLTPTINAVVGISWLFAFHLSYQFLRGAVVYTCLQAALRVFQIPSYPAIEGTL